jgi:hypothetical protein
MNQAKLIRTVAFLVCVSPVSAQSPGTFTATGSMVTARLFHTATLLIDGRVLITGGGYAGSPLATTEIYDPVTETFTAAAVMTAARTGHTATLLPDGRLLIVGGDSSIGSAELYDPSTGNFTVTGSLLMARTGFNATLLANGKVLITGGVAGQTQYGYVIGDPEVYDPSTGVFTAAGAYAGSLASLDTNVFGFGSTSTLLPNGTVLFASEPTAQVYDPVSGCSALGARLLSLHRSGGPGPWITSRTGPQICSCVEKSWRQAVNRKI